MHDTRNFPRLYRGEGSDSAPIDRPKRLPGEQPKLKIFRPDEPETGASDGAAVLPKAPAAAQQPHPTPSSPMPISALLEAKSNLSFLKEELLAFEKDPLPSPEQFEVPFADGLSRLVVTVLPEGAGYVLLIPSGVIPQLRGDVEAILSATGEVVGGTIGGHEPATANTLRQAVQHVVSQRIAEYTEHKFFQAPLYQARRLGAAG